jgi:hypothetical protein
LGNHRYISLCSLVLVLLVRTIIFKVETIKKDILSELTGGLGPITLENKTHI